jgi:hypothetical protein
MDLFGERREHQRGPQPEGPLPAPAESVLPVLSREPVMSVASMDIVIPCNATSIRGVGRNSGCSHTSHAARIRVMRRNSGCSYISRTASA